MRVFDWWFRDRRTGKIVVAQLPNLALWVFIVTVVLRAIVTGGTPRTALDWIAAVALGWWALDEVLRGVNPWRRLLGLVVFGFVVVGPVR